jgi:polyisoprenoid-binding protein YceI
MDAKRRVVVAALGALLTIRGTVGQAESGPQKQQGSTLSRYRVDPTQSRLIVETETSSLARMFSHDHQIEAGDFSGVVTFSEGNVKRASLELTVRAGSLHLIEEKSVADRAAIENALREDVLETAKYPEMSFKSHGVTSERRGDGTYDVRLTGDLRLHGVRRTMTIPARVALEPNGLHAIGILEIRQSDFNITPFSFVKGAVVIKDDVTISFDIIANRLP